MLLQPRPHRLRRLAGLLRKVGRGVGRWRRRRRAQQLVEHPRSAQNRRRAVAIGSPQQHRALAQQAPALFFGQRDLAELAVRRRRERRSGEPAVIEERVVGGQQIHHAPVFQKDIADESFRFLREIMPQLFVEHREQLRIGLHGIESREVQPLHRETGDQARGLGIGQHAPDLFLQGSGLR